MIRTRKYFAVALASLTALVVSGCEGRTPQDSSSKAAADLVFEQDGTTYSLTEGNVYRVRSNGKLEFVERFYDPEYRTKHFVTVNGRVHQKDLNSGDLYPVSREFRDGFEGAASVEDLIAPTRWHRYDTDPRRTGEESNYHAIGNRMSISTERAHEGSASLRAHALPSPNMATKAAISKGILYFEKGDHFYFSGWFYLEHTPSIVDAGAFTLVDLESSFQKYSGIRIIFARGDSLAFELKLPKTRFEQARGSEVAFPTERWVHVMAHVFLSDTDGVVQIWQDQRKVLDMTGRTLPLADTIYDTLEIGITVLGRGSRYDKVLYVDDLAISDTPISR